MQQFEDSIDVAMPVRVAYDQWTRFEQFPEFMDSVDFVTLLDDGHLEWIATIAGREMQWTAEITDQTPDTRIAWKSISGAHNTGAVLFHPLDPDHTRVTLKLDVEPDGPLETLGVGIGIVERRVKGDLARFRDHVQAAGPTGEGNRPGETHGHDGLRDGRA